MVQFHGFSTLYSGLAVKFRYFGHSNLFLIDWLIDFGRKILSHIHSASAKEDL